MEMLAVAAAGSAKPNGSGRSSCESGSSTLLFFLVLILSAPASEENGPGALLLLRSLRPWLLRSSRRCSLLAPLLTTSVYSLQGGPSCI